MASELVVDRGGVDIISKLPDPVLCHILAFLSTKESVSTSILSKRWRYLFASVSNLDLDDEFLIPLKYPDRNTAIRKFLNFVDRLLIFHTSTAIEKLSLKVGVDCSHIYSWIAIAVTLRHVRQLDLYIHPHSISNSHQPIKLLPDVLFTCKTLVALDFDILGTVLNVPNDVCLPNLKTLRLSYVEFLNDDSVQRLFSSSPLLELLHISSCSFKYQGELNISNPSVKSLIIEYWQECNGSHFRLVINVPGLIHFKYHDVIEKDYSVLVNMYSLVEADIDIVFRTNKDLHVHEQFLQAIGHVKILHLCIDLPGLPGLSHAQFLPFINLVELETYDCCWTCPGIGLFDFLQSVPNLESLRFLRGDRGYAVLSWSQPCKVPSCLLFHLKDVEIKDVYDLEFLLDMITYLLKNSNVLEKLTVSMIRLEEEEKLRITQEILKLPRSSGKCQVLMIL